MGAKVVPSSAIKSAIRERALALGFDAVGFAAAALAAQARTHLGSYLAQGLHGDMGWLAARSAERGDPRTLWPEARSVVVLGMNYGPEEDPMTPLQDPVRGTISVYARGRDYHDIVKSRLKTLARFIAETYETDLKLFVDTAPVMEKPLAERGGIGWQGKHTNLVSRELGSWLFLGEIFLPLDLEPDAAEIDHCGQCERCLTACPTGAFPAPYRLDARRCISYLTIEHKGPIAAGLRPLLGNRIYGCDDCLAVCPWNKFARATREPGLRAREGLKAPELAQLAALDDAAFRAQFSGSAIKRIGRDRFLRNVLIAIGNSGETSLLPVVRARLNDPSPLVRGMAAWALQRLASKGEVDAIRAQRLLTEPDASVRAEWEASV
ncbi:MAG TPA: tRNA epoxyqueuosine(34) reductase QueG [Stellaceae bacterium]|nr:tRNA epoxyqueuosine(34) reductase QueG [Stellaceae bacterium]